MKIVILDAYTSSLDDLNWDAFKTLGELTVYDRTPKDKIIERAKDADAVLTNKVPMFKDQLDRLPNLKYLGILATGYNNVDLEEAKRRGIPVTNIPAYGTDSVAQAVFAHILNIANMTEAHSIEVRKGAWTKSPDMAMTLGRLTELAGMKLGVIGYGAIGRRVAEIGKAFGMEVSAFSPSRTPGTSENGVSFKTRDEIFSTSDVISLNAPLNSDTRGMVNADTIKMMKDGVWIINTGRGPLIDDAALADALNSGKVGAAGLDVLSKEPPPADNPLLSAKNCHLTPHNAWMTHAARKRLIGIAFGNLKSWMDGHVQNDVS